MTKKFLLEKSLFTIIAADFPITTKPLKHSSENKIEILKVIYVKIW